MAALERLKRELPSLLDEWQTVSSDVATLDSLMNLLEQRTAVEAVRNLDCALTKVPELHVRLLVKIDMDISDDCSDLREQLDRLAVVALRMDQLYLAAGANFEQQSEADFPSMLPYNAMSDLDAVVLFMRERQRELSRHFDMLEASPRCESYVQELRRMWKIPYLSRQLFNSLKRDFSMK